MDSRAGALIVKIRLFITACACSCKPQGFPITFARVTPMIIVLTRFITEATKKWGGGREAHVQAEEVGPEVAHN